MHVLWSYPSPVLLTMGKLMAIIYQEKIMPLQTFYLGGTGQLHQKEVDLTH